MSSSFTSPRLLRTAFSLFIAILFLDACQNGNFDQLERESTLASLNIKSIRIGVNIPYLLESDLYVPNGKSLQLSIIGIHDDGSESDITSNIHVTPDWSVVGAGNISPTGIFTAQTDLTSGTDLAVAKVHYSGLDSPDYSINILASQPAGVDLWSSNETLLDDHSGNVAVDRCDQVQFAAYYRFAVNGGDHYWPVDTNITWNYLASPDVPNSIKTDNGLLALTLPSVATLSPAPTLSVEATVENTAYSRPVSVTDLIPDALRIVPNNFHLNLLETKSLAAYARYDTVEKLVSNAASWTVSSGTSVVTATGNSVQGKEAGVATVLATCSGINGSATVNVSNSQVTGIEVESPSIGDDLYIRLKIGESADLTVKATFSDLSTQSNWTDNITWSTNGADGTSIVSIESNRNGPGTARITAKNFGEVVVSAKYTNTGSGNNTPIVGNIPVIVK